MWIKPDRGSTVLRCRAASYAVLVLSCCLYAAPATAVQLGLLSSESAVYFDASVTPNPMVDLPFGDWSGKVINDSVHNLLKIDINADQDGVDGLFGGVGHGLVPIDFIVSATTQLEVVLRVDPLNQASAFRVSIQDSDTDIDEFAADEFLYEFNLAAVTPGGFVTLTQPLNAPGPIAVAFPANFIPGDGIANFGLSGIGIQSIQNGTQRLKIDLKEIRLVDTADPVLHRATADTFDQTVGRYAWFGFNPNENPNAHNDTSGDTIIIDVAPAPTPSPTNGNGSIRGGIGTPWLASLPEAAAEYQLEVDVKVLANNSAAQFAIALQDKDLVTIHPIPNVTLEGEALEQFLYTFDLANVSQIGFTTLKRRLDNWDQYFTPVVGTDGLPDGIVNLDPGLFQLEIEGLTVADRLNVEIAEIRLVSAPAGVDGDYSGNGIVDAADYTVWRNSLGQMGAGLAADGDGNGKVEPADYTYWKTRFGNPGGGSSFTTSSATPEPASLAIAVLGLAMLFAHGADVRTNRCSRTGLRSFSGQAKRNT